MLPNVNAYWRQLTVSRVHLCRGATRWLSDASTKDQDVPLIRLAKLMAQQGICSRREADAYIQGGAVLVNGKRVEGDWMRVPVDSKVTLAPEARRHQRSKVTILFNKPLGVVSCQPEKNYEPAVKSLTFANQFFPPERDHQRESRDQSSSYSNLQGRQRERHSPEQPESRDIEPIALPKMAVCGRLDVNSTGLLIFTQDGTLAKRILDPHHHIEKEYLVRVDRNCLDKSFASALTLLQQGVVVEGVRYHAKSVDVLNQDQLRFILTEGKHHHIRKMCGEVGLHVRALKRVRIGDIKLGSLPVGQWKYWSSTPPKNKRTSHRRSQSNRRDSRSRRPRE